MAHQRYDQNLSHHDTKAEEGYSVRIDQIARMTIIKEQSSINYLIVKKGQLPCSSFVDYHLFGKNEQLQKQYPPGACEDPLPQMF